MTKVTVNWTLTLAIALIFVVLGLLGFMQGRLDYERCKWDDATGFIRKDYLTRGCMGVTGTMTRKHPSWR